MKRSLIPLLTLLLFIIGANGTAFSQSPSQPDQGEPCDGYCYTYEEDSLAIECRLTQYKKDSIIARRDLQKARLDSMLVIVQEDRDDYKAGMESKQEELNKCSKELEKARKSKAWTIVGTVAGVVAGWLIRKAAVQ